MTWNGFTLSEHPTVALPPSYKCHLRKYTWEHYCKAVCNYSTTVLATWHPSFCRNAKKTCLDFATACVLMVRVVRRLPNCIQEDVSYYIIIAFIIHLIIYAIITEFVFKCGLRVLVLNASADVPLKKKMYISSSIIVINMPSCLECCISTT